MPDTLRGSQSVSSPIKPGDCDVLRETVGKLDFEAGDILSAVLARRPGMTVYRRIPAKARDIVEVRRSFKEGFLVSCAIR